MTYEDTIKIMAVLKAAYPGYYKGLTQGEAREVVALWAELFADDPQGLVALAVKRMIATDTRGFPPVIGQIKEHMAKLKLGDTLTEQEAWNLVAKAVRNSGYNAQAEFNALPEEVQRIVGSPSQLHAWSQLDSSELHTVVASNLMRSYRASIVNRKEVAALGSGMLNASEALLKAWNSNTV